MTLLEIQDLFIEILTISDYFLYFDEEDKIGKELSVIATKIEKEYRGKNGNES